jgi:Pyridoxamine 5'-phosphate oxidase
LSDLTAVDLSGEISEHLNSAYSEGIAMTLGYVDGKGRPHLSIRGSIHVHGRDQLALWIRDNYVGSMTPTRRDSSDGGIVAAIESNPEVSVLYRNAKTLTTYVLAGRARIAGDQVERDAIYDDLPAGEQGHSPNREGTAIVVDIDHVVGGSLAPGGVVKSHVEMLRS